MGGPGSSLSITVIAASSGTGKNRLVLSDVWSLLMKRRRVGERGTGQTLQPSQRVVSPVLLLHPAAPGLPKLPQLQLCPSG